MSVERAQAINAALMLVGLTAFVAATNLLPNDYLVKVIMLIGMNVILAVSLALASGFTGVFSLGQIGFMAIGAYASALLTIPPAAKSAALLPGLPSWLARLDLGRTMTSLFAGAGPSADLHDSVGSALAVVWESLVV